MEHAGRSIIGLGSRSHARAGRRGPAAKAGRTRARPPRSDTAPLREGRMSSIGPKRYAAFLSYNSQDRRAVKEVAERLKGERLELYLEAIPSNGTSVAMI